MAGLLSVVGTPIGNLQDASPRVIDVLGRADVVLCEDTRVTGKLLSAFEPILLRHYDRIPRNQHL